MSDTEEAQDVAPGEPGEPPEISDGLQAELDRCKPPLRDFGPGSDDHPGFAYSQLAAVRFDVARDRLPVIASLHLIMRLLIGAHDLGRAEKLAWEYPFTYRSRACSLTQMKLGLHLYLQAQDDGDDEADAREIVSKLAAASRLLEKNILRSLIDTQASDNRLIVHNQIGNLRGMYEYFRRLAETAYAEMACSPNASTSSIKTALLADTSAPFPSSRKDSLRLSP